MTANEPTIRIHPTGGKMKKTKWLALVFFLSLVTPMILAAALKANDGPRITKEELKQLLGKPDVVIIDVRASGDWDASESKIQGAVREDPRKLGSWLENYSKDKTLVFYCH